MLSSESCQAKLSPRVITMTAEHVIADISSSPLELKELVSMHLEQNLENEEPLTADEVLIIKVCC